ncbi:MAG: serine/threonine protein kinase [Gemmatimonadaceae bacterium]|nr:serine/threonine protein kinase [Gemmatimonadaceae bacterium]NUQ92226.1 serine/threonine protein kinase [Gemmatimonadaceae bacterium]NUR20147.1 serine/threonine protein kinase [Gemmatimonadaceae bacterium]NUS96680.1 serine/threonine protein kinase [Gemmatimonadaceae bacterium]
MSHQSLVGRTIAGYTLTALVGEGGTSAVYRAEHPVNGTVAVKVLREKLREDRTAVARFTREARFGSRVHHDNVVRTIEIGEGEPGLHFLATEWAAGELLERYARRKAPLPADEVVVIVDQIAEAVQAAHAAGIVHRDLKPDNVMYDPSTRRVKLLDFGIAADTEMGAEERLTRAGFFVGTLLYVAPEALSGELVSPAADQWSLATIAYYLLSSCHPYAARTPREMFTKLLSQPPVPLGTAKEGLRIAPGIESVVMRGLSRDPAKRYPSVREFAAALSAAVATAAAEPAVAAPSEDDNTLLEKARALFRRRRER